MVAVSVSFDGGRLSQAESETDNGTWDEFDSGKSPSQETDFVYQVGASSASISLKVGTSETGVEFEDNNTTDLETTPQTVLFKVIATNYAKLNTIGPTAMVLYVGSGTTTDRYNYYVHGSDTYPTTGGWVFVPIDPNVTAYRDATDGTPDLSAADYYAISCTFTATSKSENVAIDAIDHIGIGEGLTLTGGTAADPEGIFQDFVDEDEGIESNRWAIVRTVEGIIYALGTLNIGTATATEFTDSNRVVVFPHALVDVGFSGISIDLQNASTAVSWSDCTFVSRGKSNHYVTFDSDIDVGGASILMFVNGIFEKGDAVLYSKEGGTESIGLTDNTQYWIDAGPSHGIYNSRQDAINGTSKISLTASTAGNGEAHSFRRQPDTRATLTVSGVAGSYTANGCIFDGFRLLTLTSAATMDSCKFVNCSSIDLTTASLDGCTITSPTLAENESFITTTDLSKISTCVFTAAEAVGTSQTGRHGHAIEITASGTHTFTGNSFSGFWSHAGDAGKGAEFDTTAGVDAGTDKVTTNSTHGLSSGDAVYYSKVGGTANIGLTDGDRYYANVTSTTEFTLHYTEKAARSIPFDIISLTSTGGETHTFYSSSATILNNSGGPVTVDIVDGDPVTVRNFTDSDTTTVNISVPLELNGLSEGSYGAMIGDGGAENENFLLSGYADSTGKIIGTFSGTTPQNVIIRARNGGIIAAAIEEDNGTGFIDHTLDARNRTTPGTGTSNDVDLLPASPALNDAFYFAGLNEFGKILIDVSTAGTTYVLTWEYWNGAWTALTVVDDTNSFQTAGWNSVTFTKPGDWTTTTINSQGPFFYVRARVTTGGGTRPQANTITLKETIQYEPFDNTGIIQTSTGLIATAVWTEDTNNN